MWCAVVAGEGAGSVACAACSVCVCAACVRRRQARHAARAIHVVSGNSVRRGGIKAGMSRESYVTSSRARGSR